MTRATRLIFPLLGAAITIFQLVRDNAPRAILEDSTITKIEGFEEHDCGYGKFWEAYKETCLSGISADYPTVERVKTFYAAEMEKLGWVKIPESRHKEPITKRNTDFFVEKDSGSNCYAERSISVSQNTYRGGVKLEDISVDFYQYLVECKRFETEPLSWDETKK